MRVLMIPFGSHGDVHPMVGLGLELRSRGHEVIFFVSEMFASLVEGEGFAFTAFGDRDQIKAIMNDPDLWHPRKGFQTVAKIVAEGMRIIFPWIEENNLPGHTVTVSGTLAFAARFAQEKHGIPSATVHLQPSVFHSNINPSTYPGLTVPRWWPVWFRRLFFEFLFGKMVDPELLPQVNEYRAELGLPPTKRLMLSWIHSAQINLGFFPDWFGPPQPDWPENAHLVGFPLYDERAISPMPDDLTAFLDAGEPPLAFTPGSANVHARPFFEAAVDACQRLNKRGLLLTRHGDQIPKDLPDSVRYVPYAPFGTLLPRVAALVHHGGVGTSAQAMSCATPQLVMPLAHDQHDNAARMIRLGVAGQIEPQNFQGPNVATALDRLLSQPQLRSNCENIAERFRQGPPPMRQASEWIESLIPA